MFSNQFTKFSDRIQRLLHHYNSIIVYISIIVSIVVQFVPDTVPWKDGLLIGCVYVGVFSLVLILLDIRAIVEQHSERSHFRNLFEAKAEIFNQVEKIRRQKPRDETLEIHIIGMKLRAISSVLHELISEVKQYRRTLHNARFVIYYFDPEAFQQLISGSTPPDIASKLTQQYQQYKAISLANVQELLRYNDDPYIKTQNVKIECHTYQSLPSFWGFGIAELVAFVGPFTWNAQDYTFRGPQNPCIMVDSTDETSQVILEYHYNRCHMHDKWE